MEASLALMNANRLGPRIPSWNRDAMKNVPSRVVERGIPAQMQPRAEDCTDPKLCEKPFSASNLSLPIGLGVAIPIVLVIAFLFYLHRRNVRRVRQEDMNDAHRSLDFGLTSNPGGKKKNRRSGLLGGEKDRSDSPRHKNQLSMDMNLSSPYLLPPGLQQSRESLHSLARTLHQTDDPYRPVKYAGSDAGSLRSFRKETRGGENSSVYTDSTGRESREPRSRAGLPGTGSRKDSFPRQPHALAEQQSADAEIRVPEAALPTPPPSAAKDRFMLSEMPAEPVILTVENADPFANASPPDFPLPQVPPRAAQRILRKGLNHDPAQQDNLPPTPESMSDSHLTGNMQPFDLGIAELPQDRDLPQQPQTEPVGLGLMSPQRASIHMASPVQEPATINHHDSATLPSFPIIEEPQPRYNQQYDQSEQHGQDGRGRALHRRQSSEYPAEMPQPGLNVPQTNNKRLSVGFRPLPPDEMIEHEDPETRANRIRSFYKEYFDDSKAGDRQTQGPQYYEDYDPSYLGDAAFFDPETNAFVMPYAQPVARRAMTPPPSGSRFPGPRGPPRPYHGSMGGMSMQGRGPPMRPGSSASNRFQGPPRPGSSASARFGGRPRAGSAFSNRGQPHGKPRKPMPPPTILNTIPTPSKLKDDSFALMGALEFAPPPTYKDQAAGRSQSPIGERRPYQVNVPVSSPLVSSYNEMAALPSPHLLRKSSTFTGLDFAPPRRFKENGDAMSDAGSIRSNRSGISAVSRQAIRTGAGRVSRLPGDTVFTQAALTTTLKPEWGMRP